MNLHERSWCLSPFFSNLLGGVFLFCVASLAQTAALSVSPKLERPEIPRAEQEHFLLTARIVTGRMITEGTTKTARVTMSDGVKTHDAHVQTIDLHLATFKMPDGTIEKDFTDSYKYNIAAYRVDKMLDLNMSPTCVYREYNGKPAAFCWWLDDVMFDELARREKKMEPPDGEKWVRELNDVRVFDQLIDNEDRNQGNLLYDHNWNVWMIDHSRSFRTTTQLRKPDVLRRVSLKMMNGMRNLNLEQCNAQLKKFLTDDQIRCLLVRRDLLLKFFADEIKDKGAEAIYTDLPRSTPRVTIP
jgi:hypothetical protein